MPAHSYTTVAGRINEAKGEILAHAEHVEVLDKGCTMKPMPKKQGDNITYRRWLPFGATSTNVNTQNRPAATASAHIVQEGVTPSSDTLTPVDVNVVQQQYACMYSYTDKAELLYEDDIPAAEIENAGNRMGLVREMVRYGAIKSCTNVLYSGGTTRATVDEAISRNVLARMTRVLKLNHAEKKTSILKPGPDYDTSAIRPSYMVIVSTDVQPDIEDVTGFTPVEKYSRFDPISVHEIGATPDYRFILSPELTPYTDAGALTGVTGLVSSGTKVDVYPFLMMGKDAVYDVTLKGEDSFKVNHLGLKPDKSDPGGQRGYIYCGFWDAVAIINGGFMGVIEAGTRTLT